MENKRQEDFNIKNENRQTLLVSLQAHTIGKLLLWMAFGLTITHAVCMVTWYMDMLPFDDRLYISFFDLDEEESLGTWFSTLILFLAGILSLFQARYAGKPRQRMHVFWWLLGIGFCLLSLDEIAGFHEFVNTVSSDTHWTTYGVMLVFVTGFVLLPFLRSLPTRTQLQFLIAGAVYVGGAIGVEWATIWYEENDQLDTLAYNLWNALEEFMEMTGVILYIYAVLTHITDNRQGVHIHIQHS